MLIIYLFRRRHIPFISVNKPLTVRVKCMSKYFVSAHQVIGVMLLCAMSVCSVCSFATSKVVFRKAYSLRNDSAISVTMSNDNRLILLVSASGDGSVWKNIYKGWDKVFTILDSKSSIKPSFSSDGKYLMKVGYKSLGDTACINHHPVHLFSCNTQRMNRVHLIKPYIPLKTAKFSPSGKDIVMIGDKDIMLTGFIPSSISKIYEAKTTAEIYHDHPVRAVEFSANSKFLAIGSVDGYFQIRMKKFHKDSAGFAWRKCCDSFKLGDFVKECMDDAHVDACFSAKGSHLLMYLEGGKQEKRIFCKVLNRLDKNHWNEEALMFDENVRLYAAVFSPDEQYLAMKLSDYTIQILRFGAGGWSENAKIVHSAEINDFSFSKSGDHIVTASCDRSCEIWKLDKEGKQWRQQQRITHFDSVSTAAFSSDGKFVVTASLDKTAQVWGRASDGTWVQNTIIAHGAPVDTALFFSDGQRILTFSKASQEAEVLKAAKCKIWHRLRLKGRKVLQKGSRINNKSSSVDCRF